MASSAAGEPSPPPPGGWLSGLVSGAGRILAGVAAVLGQDSSSDATSSSPESSQSPPPSRRARSAADQGNWAHFAYDNYQLDKSGRKIVLKDYGKTSCELASDIDRKDDLAQLLMKETFSRSEYLALTKIIQERVVDSDPSINEPDLVLPIAWKPNTQQSPVALRPKSSPPQMSGVPAYSPLFDNTDENIGPEKSSTTLENPCTLKNLSHDQHRHVLKRSHSNTGDTFEKPRRIRPKRNRSNTVDNVPSGHAVFDDPVTIDADELRGFPEELKDISLLGTDNLTFSKIASKGETARPIRHMATTSHQADANKHGSAMFCPYSYEDLTETFPVKVEPFDEFASLEREMMHPGQKNDERTMSNDCPVSKMIFQENIDAVPSSSNGLQPETSSRKSKKGFNLQDSIPTKSRSPANRSRRPSNRRTMRSWNGPPQQSNPASSVRQEPNARHVQAKRPVGRPKKAKRSRNTDREVKTNRRLQL